MTPMTGAVSNAHENEFIFVSRFLKSFIAPRIPIYRIVRVLKQVGTFGVYKSVGLFIHFDKITSNKDELSLSNYYFRSNI
jgi:hypothetical protein